MFWGAEEIEGYTGTKMHPQRPSGVAAAAPYSPVPLSSFIGQPTTEDRWAGVADEKIAASAREVQIHPGELLDLLHNRSLIVNTDRCA